MSNQLWAAGIALAAVLIVAPVSAQDPDLVLYYSDEAGQSGSQVVVGCLFDNTGTDLVQGWSLGACVLSNLGMVSAEQGSTTATINNGSPPDFQVINEFFPPDQPGATQGVVISFQGTATLPPGTGYELMILTVSLDGPAGTTGILEYCTVLGNPPVALAITIAGQTFLPTTLQGQVDIQDLPPLSLSAPMVEGSAGQVLSAPVVLVNPVPVYGLSFGLAHDGTVATLTSIDLGQDVQNADYAVLNENPVGGDGGIVAIIIDLGDPGPLQFLPPSTGAEVAVFNYQIAGGASPPDTSSLDFVSTLSPPAPSPPVEVLVSLGQEVIVPQTDSGLITVTDAPMGTLFVRGDVNDDGNIDLADAIFLLDFLFVQGPDPSCEKSADGNDDSNVDVADAVYLLDYLFVQGPDPLPPFPGCGLDPTDDTIPCVTFANCP